MNNNDFDFIKNRFDNDEITPPVELDQRVLSRLDDVSKKRIPFIKSRAFRSAVSLVACLAIVIVGAKMVNFNDKIEQTPKQSVEAMQTFASDKELNAYLKDAIKDNKHPLFYTMKGQAMSSTDYSNDKDIVAEDQSEVQSSHATTYIQEQGVDEADVIKTDGKYIYRSVEAWGDDYRTSGINIYEANDGKTTKISSIEFKTDTYQGNTYFSREIIDFFLKEDRLVVELNTYSYGDRADGCDNTECIVYDITNPQKPSKLYSFSQKGYYTSSRMIDDTLYLVSSYGFFYCSTPKECIPTYCDNDGESVSVEACDIAYPECRADSFTIVSAIDTKNGKRLGKTKSVVGAGNDVYCTTNALYILGTTYNENTEKTFISKVDFKNGVEFGPSVKIKGRFDNQYAFCEKGDYFFACVTYYNQKLQKDLNYLYSFDKNLKQLDKTESFGIDESVRAVKYIGDYAYVITYEQTDPLFVIDISSPDDLKIKGSVKISGFSTMLVPIGDDKLLGIGNATEDSEFSDMEAISGVKLALFDISNPNEPKVLDSKEYKKYSSEAQNNPKALIVNEDKDYMAIPIDKWDEDESGALIFDVKDNKIVEKDSFYNENKDDTWRTRITFIDDYIYTLDGVGNVNSHIVK